MQQNLILRSVMFCLIFSLSLHVSAQRFLSDYDSTFFMKDTLRPFLKRMENLHFSGYIQPQFQVAEKKGASSFEGGDFSDSTNSRFMLRRARIKVDYILPPKNGRLPAALFTFQFDITERGAFARDIFLKLYGPKKQRTSLTMGLFARPFGYEVNLSSAFRESPERGRMSQILMPAERDLGAMVSYESVAAHKKPIIKFDFGVFNGPGLSAPTDYDPYKDFISRIVTKPFELGRRISMGAGVSWLNGGWLQTTKYQYETANVNGLELFVVDSSVSNRGSKSPKRYYGADMQWVYKNAWGKTEIRGEYWRGKQPGTATTSANPGSLPQSPTYIRTFDGAFIYFLQNLVNSKWELVLKYDWYDPNRKVSKKKIGIAGSNFTPADIRFETFGFGLNHYLTEQLRLLAYYSLVRNEITKLSGYDTDRADNIFTFRMQLRF